MVLAQHVRLNALDNGVVLIQLCRFHGVQNIDSIICNSQILIFAEQSLHPRQSGAHSTSHACHALDTTLDITPKLKSVDVRSPPLLVVDSEHTHIRISVHGDIRMSTVVDFHKNNPFPSGS